MAMRKILVDETNRELCEHGTVGFPMTVNHDDLWAFEGKSVPIHWHNDLEISLPREGEAIYQVYRKSYTVRPGDVLLLNRNVPHSCHSPNNSHARYSTFLTRPDFMYGEYGSDVERRCFRPFLQNSAVPCILLTSGNSCTRTVIQKLNETEALFDQKTFCYELKIKGILCEIFGMILCEHQNDLAKFIPANQLELERLEQMLDYLNTHFESVISAGTGGPGSSVQRGLLPPVQKNDRQDNYRLSGRISCHPKSASGSELPVFYDPDCRYDRLQQRQPFCPGISPTIRMQSR